MERTEGFRLRSGCVRSSSLEMTANTPLRSFRLERARERKGSSFYSAAVSRLLALAAKSGESSAMKCVPPGLLG